MGGRKMEFATSVNISFTRLQGSFPWSTGKRFRVRTRELEHGTHIAELHVD